MIHLGDCLDVMRGMEPNSVDAIVTDPPYGLEFMGKEWDRLIDKRPSHDEQKAAYQENGRHGGGSDPYVQSRVTYQAGIQAQEWHYSWAVEALRVAKPGAILMAFGGTRTWHRLACALEDTGWEIRDTIMWVYGSGFPKSLDMSKAIDKAAGAGRIVIGSKKITGLLPDRENFGANDRSNGKGMGFRPGDIDITSPATEVACQWQGWGTALKPAWEPIILARKPLEGTVAENVQKWGVAGLNIDGCRVEINENDYKGKGGGGIHGIGKKMNGNTYSRGRARVDIKQFTGRWPANLIHDGSEEVLELFPETKSGGGNKRSNNSGMWSGKRPLDYQCNGDSGSAARFFYCAKASRKEREAGLKGMEERIDFDYLSNGLREGGERRVGRKARNHHPTVKPLALMRYLCRLVTPPNGLVLDPFMGSGTTGMAATLEGFRFIGIEKEAEYCEIAKRRIEATA